MTTKTEIHPIASDKKVNVSSSATFTSLQSTSVSKPSAISVSSSKHSYLMNLTSMESAISSSLSFAGSSTFDPSFQFLPKARACCLSEFTDSLYSSISLDVRVVFCGRQTDNGSSSRWLLVQARLDYKMVAECYHCLQGLATPDPDILPPESASLICLWCPPLHAEHQTGDIR